jgi:hypothetical protein
VQRWMWARMKQSPWLGLVVVLHYRALDTEALICRDFENNLFENQCLDDRCGVECCRVSSRSILDVCKTRGGGEVGSGLSVTTGVRHRGLGWLCSFTTKHSTGLSPHE